MIAFAIQCVKTQLGRLTFDWLFLGFAILNGCASKSHSPSEGLDVLVGGLKCEPFIRNCRLLDIKNILDWQIVE